MKQSLHDLQRDFGRALRAPRVPPALEGTRAAAYFQLVRANFDQVLRDLLPRTAARLGDRFWDEARAFVHERGPQTHYLRDVPSELVAWALERWPRDEAMPPWAIDLARYEVASHQASAAPGDHETEADRELTLDRPVIMADHVRFLLMSYAVHELPADEDDASVPAARDVALLVYRDGDHDLRYLELTAAAAAIVERLLRGDVVSSAVTEGAASAGVPVDEAFLQGTSRLLADLAQRGALLGGRRLLVAVEHGGEREACCPVRLDAVEQRAVERNEQRQRRL